MPKMTESGEQIEQHETTPSQEEHTDLPDHETLDVESETANHENQSNFASEKPTINDETYSNPDEQQAEDTIPLEISNEPVEDTVGNNSNDHKSTQEKSILYLTEQMKELNTTQQQLKKDFNEKLKYDAHKEHLINKLHRELQDYKGDIVKSTIKPLINDLIMLNDTIYKLVDNYRSSEEPLNAEEILTQLEHITMDIDDVLYRQGIESFTLSEDEINPLKQTILHTVNSDDQTKEKQVAERLRKGYEWDETVIRKELVTVYVYNEESNGTEQHAEGENENDE